MDNCQEHKTGLPRMYNSNQIYKYQRHGAVSRFLRGTLAQSISPSTIYVTSRGAWKLGGLEHAGGFTVLCLIISQYVMNYIIRSHHLTSLSSTCYITLHHITWHPHITSYDDDSKKYKWVANDDHFTQPNEILYQLISWARIFYIS